MNYFIILTRDCNLRCKYCGEDASFEEQPLKKAYPLDVLRKFLKYDKSPVTIQFYGGEPLLEIPFMEELMDELTFVKHWSVQTNALFLNKLKKSYLKKLSAILVSIDGREEVNNTNRGKGVYKKVLQNCVVVQEQGYSGELIARMTVFEDADIFEEVTHLALLRKPQLNYIHWQLDTQWDDNVNNRWKDFEFWVETKYNPGITKLVNWWVEMMEQGQLIGIVPFMSLMYSILSSNKSQLRCGAGIDSFAINPNGTISVCPISPQFQFSMVGDIWRNRPQDIRNSIFIGNPCLSCEIFSICGGRCLFANKAKLWGEIGFAKVCNTVFHLINNLEKVKPKVEKIIEKGIFSKTHFFYPQYNNGCEIIP